MVWCSCTLAWCKNLRDEGKADGVCSFKLPTGALNDPVKRHEVVDVRARVQGKLRPGTKKELNEKSRNGFLYWHLHPSSFVWKSTFTRCAKRRRPCWEVREIKISTTKQTPPPPGVQAKWDGHHWMEVLADGSTGAVVAAGSASVAPLVAAPSSKRFATSTARLIDVVTPPHKRVVRELVENVEQEKRKGEKEATARIAAEASAASLRRELQEERDSRAAREAALLGLLQNKRDETKSLKRRLKANLKRREELRGHRKELQGRIEELAKERVKLQEERNAAEEATAAATAELDAALIDELEALRDALDAVDEKADDESSCRFGLRWADFEASAANDQKRKGRKGLCNHVAALTGCRYVAVLHALFVFLEAHGAGKSSFRRSAKTSSGGAGDGESMLFSTTSPVSTGLTFRDRVLIGLFILRTGVSCAVASGIFDVAETTVRECFEFAVILLAHFAKLYNVPASKELLELTCPDDIRKRFKRPVSYFLDASEIFLEVPDDKEVQKVTWSEYKHRNTTKVLGALSASGSLAWMSEAYPGSIGDKSITAVSGFLLCCVFVGHMIVADKGFEIFYLLAALGAILRIPPKKRRKIDTLSAEDCKSTAKIANVRIHVERAFAALKVYRWLEKISMKQIDLITPAVLAATFLVNLNNPPFRGKK